MDGALVHTGAVMLLVSLVGFVLHRSLARIAGQISTVATSLAAHIAEDVKQREDNAKLHDEHTLAVQELWRAAHRR